MNDYEVYGALFLLAAGATYLLTFPVARLAKKAGVVDEPDERRVHTRTTPTVGGAAMLLAFLVAMMAASRVHNLDGIFQRSSEPLGIVLAAAVIFGVGLYDDIKEMSAPAKMAGQVLAAAALFLLGVTMYHFKIPFAGFVILSPQLTPLLTALWVIVIANAVNFIDGLDGLAAGVVAIAAGTLCVYGLRLETLGVLPADNIGPLIAAVTCGVCVGFLPHNFHPARIFMGDAGALLIGLLMAVSTMVIGGRTTDVSGQTYFFFAPLFLPFFILGVPALDAALAIVRRTASRSSLARPDIDHLHHRLLRLGHGHRRAVVILWAWTAILCGFVLFPTFDPRTNAYIPFGVAALGVALYTLFHPGIRQKPTAQAGDATTPTDAPGQGGGTPEDTASGRFAVADEEVPG